MRKNSFLKRELARRVKGTLVLFWMMNLSLPAQADEAYYNDPPPAQATAGFDSALCPAPKVVQLSESEARAQAHSRIERGTSCALAGTCEPGGVYKHDAEINQRVVDLLHADARFANSSLWVETLRHFVTIKGCLRDEAEGRAIEAAVKGIEGVQLVWMEAKVVH